MSRRKWLETEASKWIDEGIITDEQRRQIVSRYQQPIVGSAMISLLAGLLVGVGVISFIAANWQGISPLFKLILIMAGVAASYWSGEKIREKGKDRLGIGLTFLGVLFFGAGIFLIGQIYHLVSFNAGALYAWFVGAALIAYLYRSRFIFGFSLILLIISQFYSIEQFNRFSFMSFFLYLILVIPFQFKYPHPGIHFLAVATFTMNMILLISQWNLSILWLLLYATLLLLLAVLTRDGDFSFYTRMVAYLIGFIISVFIIFGVISYEAETVIQTPYLYGGLLLILFAVFLGKIQQNTESARFSPLQLAEWLLFVPVFFFLNKGLDLAYILILYLFSLGMILNGIRQADKSKINIGVLGFLLSTIVAYTQFAWDFMPKSLFFILGGLILFALSILLERKRREWMKQEEEAAE